MEDVNKLTAIIRLTVEEQSLLIDLIELLPVDLVGFIKGRRVAMRIRSTKWEDDKTDALIESINNKVITAQRTA